MKKCLLVLSVLLLVGCGKDTVSDVMPKDAFIDIKLDDIPVFEEVYVSDLISDTNVNIEDYLLNTDVIGEKEVEFYYTYQDNIPHQH